MKALNELQLRQISACPGNIELQDWLKILVADNAVLVRSLTVIANSDEHHGKTMVCDFDSLIHFFLLLFVFRKETIGSVELSFRFLCIL